MKKQIAALILAAIPMCGFAAGGAYPLEVQKNADVQAHIDVIVDVHR